MRDFRYMAIVAAAALGLALAGCSSDGGPSQAELTAEKQTVATLQGQINALRAQLGLPADEGDAAASVKELQDEVADLKKQIADAASDDEKADLAKMVAEAAMLYAGISAQMGDGDLTNLEANDRDAGYGGTNDNQILVSIGGDAAAAAAITLSEDKKTTVADNHGWAGKRYADPAGGDSYEAVVYSNVEAPKMGKKFGSLATIPNTNFEYQLNAQGRVVVDTSTTAVQARVGGSSFDHSAGTKEFKLPTNTVAVPVPGSYHGVSGTYYCTPTDGNTCAASVATRGFTLGLTADFDNTFTASTTAWVFMPSDANARVMSAPDAAYASYGWWLHKSENGKTFTASAFHDEKGGVEAASGLNALNGTARYVGGAAGKYALSSATGGTNDAGHFTARATLDANFTTNTAPTAIDGTIDMIRGADGELRPWSVKLNGSPITDTGGIGEAGDDTADNAKTVWTIDEVAAKSSGTWTGSLRNNGDDGVPQVATGTFYTEYGTAGRMVGAFGANKQQ